MSLADYNSFGIIPITGIGYVAKEYGGGSSASPPSVDIEEVTGGEYIRVHTAVGDKFVIVQSYSIPDQHIYPYIITTETGTPTFFGQGDSATNYEIEITTDKIGGQSGYIYFNNIVTTDNKHLLVYQDTGRKGLLHQAVQNELIMLIQKQLKEMNE